MWPRKPHLSPWRWGSQHWIRQEYWQVHKWNGQGTAQSLGEVIYPRLNRHRYKQGMYHPSFSVQWRSFLFFPSSRICGSQFIVFCQPNGHNVYWLMSSSIPMQVPGFSNWKSVIIIMCRLYSATLLKDPAALYNKSVAGGNCKVAGALFCDDNGAIVG